jgi:dGTP triphosphohydrolase
MTGHKKTRNKKELVASVRDFIAGMTDRYAILTFDSLFVPSERNR